MLIKHKVCAEVFAALGIEKQRVGGGYQTVINYNPEVEFTYRDITFQFSENLKEETEETEINPVSQKWSVEVSGLIPKVKPKTS